MEKVISHDHLLFFGVCCYYVFGCNDSAGVQYDYHYLVIFKIVNLEQSKCVNGAFPFRLCNLQWNFWIDFRFVEEKIMTMMMIIILCMCECVYGSKSIQRHMDGK